MAKGQKRQSGPTAARTVMKLQPVRYRITLCYLGHARIAHDDATYRCKYTLEPGETPGSGAAFHERDPEKIPNIIRGNTKSEDEKRCSTPLDKGGDNSKPEASHEKVYRVMVLDNHGMRSADVDLLGQSPGDTESKVANYKKAGGDKRDWMPDVSPAVPLRIVVRKYLGDAQVSMTKPLKAVVHIKDPVEESAIYNTARAPVKDFLGKFFKKYNQGSADPNIGNDNCETKFKGKRGTTAGVKAVDVLKKVPYKKKPVAEAPPSDPKVSVAFSELSAATANGTMDAEFPIELQDEDDKKIGVADLAFLPYPAFGDNYRFLISLFDGTQDVRDTKENGRSVELIDSVGDPIPKPRAYTTGRFVMWKRAEIKLVVLVNKTEKTIINWDAVIPTYRRAFIDLVKPDDTNGYYKLTAQQWLTELKAVFTADTVALDALATAAAPNDLAATYKKFFFPKPLTDKYVDGGAASGGKVQFNGGGLNGQIFPMASRIIQHACTKLKLEFPGSTDGKKQGKVVRDRKSEGFYVVLMHNPSPTSNLLGESAGDRMFWFCVTETPTAADLAITSQTFQHEMGHAQYLRHSHTMGLLGGGGGGGDSARWQGATVGSVTPPIKNIRLFGSHPNQNNQVIDHDQNDAYDCTMSYTCSRLALPIPDFCGLCNLTLRFYDRVEIQKSGEYRSVIQEGQKDLVIVSIELGGGNVWRLRQPPTVGANPKLPNIAVGGKYFIACVGKEFTPTSNGSLITARTNLTIASTGGSTSHWSQAGGGSVALLGAGTSSSGHVIIEMEGKTAGDVTLTFTRDGMTATAVVTVTP